MVSPLSVVNGENIIVPVELESAINSTSSSELEIATKKSKIGVITKSQSYLCAMESEEITACLLLRKGNFHSTYIIAFKRNIFFISHSAKSAFPSWKVLAAEMVQQLKWNLSSESVAVLCCLKLNKRSFWT